MYARRAKAWKLFTHVQMHQVKAQMKWIPNVLLRLNIVLGVIALGLGVTLRGL
jgi:hypothetical protein